MKIESFHREMIVYDVHSHFMGNTKMRTVGVWTVRIISIDLEKQIVVASWNGNEPRHYHKRSWSKWRFKRPVLITNSCGQSRLATREELKELKEKKRT